MALDEAGEHENAGRFHDWVAARTLGLEPRLRSAIEAIAAGRGRGGEDFLPCRFAPGGHAPTGDGWGAFQMDGPGLWLWSLQHHARSADGSVSLGQDLRRAAAVATEYIAALWRQPSYDAWEEHGDHLATSTLAACLAGLLAAHRLGVETEGMHTAVEGIRREIGARGRRFGYLPRSDADDTVDASILWCGPPLGAIHPSDPAWRGTIERVERDLVGPRGGVHRFASDTFYGGGQWPVLTAALGLVYVGQGHPGDIGRAQACADWIERQRRTDGSLPEQVSDHLLHPEHRAVWEVRWGPVASPLSWSHAMAVLLRHALAAADAGGQPAT